jgi:DNA-binding CsgD family transcriptional regulator
VLRHEFGEGLPIMLVSGDRTEAYDRVAGLLIGADDYLVKPYAPDELLARARRLLRRATPIAPPVAAKLTLRETEVLSLLAEGLEQDEIAARLFITRKTVGTHIEHILKKLGVRSRAQAVALAYRSDLVEVPAPEEPPATQHRAAALPASDAEEASVQRQARAEAERKRSSTCGSRASTSSGAER